MKRKRQANGIESLRFGQWPFADEVESADAADSKRKAYLIEQLEAERDELKSVIALYDKALKASWPRGAKGDAFDYWNAARKIIAKVNEPNEHA